MPTPKGGYRTKDGKPAPSVTTILGRFKDSGALIKWAYKQGREHENLAMRKLPAPAHLYDKVEEAALAGTIAHHLIDTHIRHGADKVAEHAQEYANTDPAVKKRAWNGYQQFIKWLDNSRIVVDGHERQLVSEQYAFGGTPDAVGVDADGNFVLVDWKTSNKVYGDMLFQLAAYSILIEEVEGRVATGFHLLRVAKESADFAHHHYGDLSEERRGFLLMRELYEITFKAEKRA